MASASRCHAPAQNIFQLAALPAIDFRTSPSAATRTSGHTRPLSVAVSQMLSRSALPPAQLAPSYRSHDHYAATTQPQPVNHWPSPSSPPPPATYTGAQSLGVPGNAVEATMPSLPCHSQQVAAKTPGTLHGAAPEPASLNDPALAAVRPPSPPFLK